MVQKLLPILIFLLLFFVFLIPVLDTDFGWHLRCGQQIFEDGKLCQTNHFTTLLENYKWHSPAHFYQILLFLTFKYFGFVGLTFLYGLSAALVLIFFIRSFGKNLIIPTLIVFLVICFSWSNFNIGFRSQVLSIYFLLIFLAVIKLSQSRPKLIFLLPVLSGLWANSHSGFFLGPIIFLFFFTDTLIRYLLKLTSKKYLATITFITGLNFLTTLINPYGFGIYQEVLRHSQVVLNTLIAEWVPPLAWQIFIVLSATVWLSSKSWNRKDFFSIFLLVFFAYLTIQARRNLPLFSSVFAYSLINSLPDNFEGIMTNKRVQKICVLLAIAITTFLTYKNLPLALNYNEDIYCQKALVALPCGGVKFMSAQKTGRIFNTYEWGGYLIWKLPQFKIFADGRMPSWDTTNETSLPVDWRGKSPYSIYIETIQMQPGWQEVIKNNLTDYIMIQNGVYLDLFLKQNETKTGFKNIYNDGVASIYGRI